MSSFKTQTLSRVVGLESRICMLEISRGERNLAGLVVQRWQVSATPALSQRDRIALLSHGVTVTATI